MKTKSNSFTNFAERINAQNAKLHQTLADLRNRKETEQALRDARKIREIMDRDERAAWNA